MMPLVNGSSAVIATTTGLAAISTNPPAVMDIKYSGIGLLTGENGQDIDYYCSLLDRGHEGDGFDAKGSNTGGNTDEVEIIGGSGR